METRKNNKNEYICWYAYSGHETEGNVFLHEPLITEAVDEAEAMWEYHIHLHSRDKTQWDPRRDFKDVDDYRKNDKNITGWGFWCRKLCDE